MIASLLRSSSNLFDYKELIGSKVSSFGPCFSSRIDYKICKKKYFNSRFRSETRFQSCFLQIFAKYITWERNIQILYLRGQQEKLWVRRYEHKKKKRVQSFNRLLLTVLLKALGTWRGASQTGQDQMPVALYCIGAIHK